ncbi:MAG: hypothetical protein M1831_004091 [Alyxoria varia]|nr:MAG: hypothetical protein M1831_004091 [Alyxoria varia]
MKATSRILNRGIISTQSCIYRPQPATIAPLNVRSRNLHSTHHRLADSAKSSADAEKANLLNRENMSPTSNEYSKTSGGGDSAAAHSDTAFDPETTGPEEQREKEKDMRGDAGDDPLAVSPGDKGTRGWMPASEGKDTKDVAGGKDGGGGGDGESRAMRERRNTSANQRK